MALPDSWILSCFFTDMDITNIGWRFSSSTFKFFVFEQHSLFADFQ